MSNKYILNILEKNVVSNIILIDGELTESEFKKGNLDDIIDFTPEEKSILKVSSQSLHEDDTIDTLKKKIVIEYENTITTEMIYLFYLTKMELVIDNVFSILTQNRTITIDKNRLFGFLLNIVDVKIDDLDDKEVYTYEDLLKLNIYGEHIVKVPLGLSYNIEDKYPFTVNPYDIIEFDPFLETYSTNIVSTQNKNILLDYDILGNNIYVCFTDDIIGNLDVNKSSLLQIYYPFLYSQGITTQDKFYENKDELVIKDNSLYDTHFVNNNLIINLFYDIFKTRKTELDKLNSGVKELQFIIHPIQSIVFPIDVIFKIFSTNKDIPLTKYNTGIRSEKLYRLFSPYTSLSGKKVPFLKKSKIFKLINLISREKSIGIYFEDEHNILIIEFYVNGNIKVKYISRLLYSTSRVINYENIMNIKLLEDYLIEKINDILKPINFYIQKSGYKNIVFSGFKTNVEIVNLEYTEVVKISKKINIDKFINCFSSVFVFLETDIMKGIEMDFKRVSHFNSMSSIDKYISRQYLKNDSKDGLISNLIDVFNISEEDARKNVTKFLSNVEVEQNLYRNRRLKIKTSSGFPITIIRDKFTDNIIININNINNIGYVDLILIYLDSMIRITQDINSSGVDGKLIKSMCKKAYKQESEVIDIASVKQIPEEKTDIAIEDGKLVFDEEDEDDNDLDFLNSIYGEQETLYEDDSVELDDILNLTALNEEDDFDSEVLVEPKLQIEQEVKFDREQHVEEEDDITIQDGMPLNNPNYFFERMYRRDPKLFLKRKDGKYEAYSRMCPQNLRRQPVLINQEEKDKIDVESPGSYGEGDVAALKYSSDPSKNYYYICPRYWCLKTNMSMTQEQVDAGECGGKIIPYEAKKVPKGTYIYEFNAGKRNNEHLDKHDKYIQHYPGFLKSDSHPDGLCVPCCVKNPHGNSQKIRRKECALGKIEVKHKKQKKRGIQRLYVKEMNKFPLDEMDIAYLPISIQKILNVDNDLCRVSKKNNALISNKPCLLRKGLLNKIQNQSFMYAIADVLGITLQALKKQIINKLTLVDFMKLQNGSLVDIFYDKNIKEDLSLLKDDTLKNVSREFVLKVNKSFINYRNFINDDSVEINYMYTWDLVCNIVFEDTKNLIILEVLEDDLTDNVDLICPTNHFSNNNFFNSKKHSIIVIKKDIFYYPVYLFINDKDSGENEIEVYMKQFSVFDTRIGENLKKGLMSIKQHISLCKPNSINHEKYYFKDNIHHDELLKITKKNKYKLLKQVLNYDGKKIAFIFETPSKKTVYVPSSVSNVIKTVDIIDMNDLSIREDLKTTIDELLELSKLSVPCKPHIKVKEDGLIVGILTETNQFVPLIRPQEDIDLHSIKTQEGIDTINIDTQIMTSNKEDVERKQIIKKINLESQFYNTFRNTFRILINQSIHFSKREKLKEIIDTYDIYIKKLDNIVNILRILLKEYIEFTIYKSDILDNIEIVKPCVELEECSEYYSIKDAKTNTCKLLIPLNNLINEYSNKEVYYKRLADELIRYRHLHKYYFNKNTHITLDTVNYNLNDTEIIVLENLLLGDYFLDMHMLESNKYTDKSTREYINPITDKIFKNVINLRKEKTLEDEECISENIAIGSTEKWYSLFEKGTKFLKVKNDSECMFTVVSKIIYDFKKETVTNKKLKEVLINQYSQYLSTYSKEIIKTLKIQGKTDIISRIKRKDATLTEIISTSQYYLTNLDLIMLFKKYKIPVVFISATLLKENNKSMFVINYSQDIRYYYVVKQYGIVLNMAQKYGVLMFNKNIKLDLISIDNDLSDSLVDNILESPFIKDKKKIKLLKPQYVLEPKKQTNGKKQKIKLIL